MTRVFLLSGLSLLVSVATLRSQDNQKPDNPSKRRRGEETQESNPVHTEIDQQGHAVFVRYCTSCHGTDGKATVDVVADASDLTAPKTWKNGYTEGEIFRSIREGESASMPAFKSQLRQEQDMWHLVNFIMSLWPEIMRPPLREDK